jgi:shikimate kinase
MGNIYLLGFMGSGKSSLGKNLAKLIAYDFVDLDATIEAEKQVSITQLFAHSENDFREAEKNCLQNVAQKSKQVVAVGGGTPCFFNNMDLMNATGLTIYLSMPVAALHSRLKNAKDNRPLLAPVTDAALLPFIGALMHKREPFYLKAQLHVSALDCKAAYINNLIKLSGWEY